MQGRVCAGVCVIRLWTYSLSFFLLLLKNEENEEEEEENQRGTLRSCVKRKKQEESAFQPLRLLNSTTLVSLISAVFLKNPFLQ